MNENKLYIKAVDLDEIYSFIVEGFSFETIYGPRILFEVLKFWNSIFWIVQTTLDGKTTKTKVIDLDEIYNFVVDNYFIINHL